MDGSEVDIRDLQQAAAKPPRPAPKDNRWRLPAWPWTGRVGAPSDQARQRRLWLEWFTTSLCASLLLVTLIYSGAATRIDNAIYDRVLMLKPMEVRKDIAIVAIDSATLDHTGEWPWRRRLLANLIDTIARGGPKALACHFLFLFPTTPDEDMAVHDAMMKTRTYLGIPHRVDSKGRASQIVHPTPRIESAAKGLGAGDSTADSDGIVRRTDLFEGPPDTPSARMVLQMARLAGKGPDPGEPHNRDDRMLIPFTGHLGKTFETYSAQDLLTGKKLPTVLKNKFVLLGATATELLDNYSTPGSGPEGMPSVEVDAHILNGLLTGTQIREASPLVVTLASLTLLWVVLFSLVRLGPRENLWLAIGLSALPLAASMLLLIVLGFWLPPVAYLLTVAIVVPYWGWRRLHAASVYFREELNALEAQADEFVDGSPRAKASVGGDMVLQQMLLLEDTKRQISNLRQFVADVLANFPDPVFVVDRAGHILDSNQAARDFAKRVGAPWTRRALIAPTLMGITPLEGETRPFWPPADELEGAVAGARARPITGFGPSGHAYELRCTETHNPEDEPTGWIVHLADVTNLVSAMRQREEALQLLSHDMRSPLAAILATLDLPENQEAPIDLRRRIADQAMRTLNLADDFIRLAKAQSDNYRFEDIDLAHIALDAADAVWPLAQAGGVSVKIPVMDAEYVVMADRSLLTRALVNLLDNAVKFSSAGTEVVCSLKPVAHNGCSAVTVAITDHAGGMTPAQIDNLFKKFASARTAVSGASGVGLGLLLVDAVVTRHGGMITCHSVEGAGTTFAITLPLVDEPQPRDEN